MQSSALNPHLVVIDKLARHQPCDLDEKTYQDLEGAYHCLNLAIQNRDFNTFHKVSYTHLGQAADRIKSINQGVKYTLIPALSSAIAIGAHLYLGLNIYLVATVVIVSSVSCFILWRSFEQSKTRHIHMLQGLAKELYLLHFHQRLEQMIDYLSDFKKKSQPELSKAIVKYDPSHSSTSYPLLTTLWQEKSRVDQLKQEVQSNDFIKDLKTFDKYPNDERLSQHAITLRNLIHQSDQAISSCFQKIYCNSSLNQAEQSQQILKKRVDGSVERIQALLHIPHVTTLGEIEEDSASSYLHAIIQLFRFNAPLRDLIERNLFNLKPFDRIGIDLNEDLEKIDSEWQKKRSFQSSFQKIIQDLDEAKSVQTSQVKPLEKRLIELIPELESAPGHIHLGGYIQAILEVLSADKEQDPISLAITASALQFKTISQIFLREDSPFLKPTNHQAAELTSSIKQGAGFFQVEIEVELNEQNLEVKKDFTLLDALQNLPRTTLSNTFRANTPYHVKRAEVADELQKRVNEPYFVDHSSGHDEPQVMVYCNNQPCLAGAYDSRMSFYQFPSSLIFNFNRFRFNSSNEPSCILGSIQCQKQLQFYAPTFDSNEEGEVQANYQIQSLIVGKKNKEQGQMTDSFIIYIYSDANREWVRIDGDKVQIFPEESDPSITEEVYIASYVKI